MELSSKRTSSLCIVMGLREYHWVRLVTRVLRKSSLDRDAQVPIHLDPIRPFRNGQISRTSSLNSSFILARLTATTLITPYVVAIFAIPRYLGSIPTTGISKLFLFESSLLNVHPFLFDIFLRVGSKKEEEKSKESPVCFFVFLFLGICKSPTISSRNCVIINNHVLCRFIYIYMYVLLHSRRPNL